MRIVLDTNVIVAAFAARGLCAEVFEVCVTGHTLVISEHILSEVNSALLKKIKLQKSIPTDVINYLRDIGEIVEPDPIDSSVCRDKDDLIVIGAAIRGKATVLVTGDADILSLRNYQGVDFITPREFWNRMR